MRSESELPFLERDKDIEIDVSDVLPHWYQSGKIISVTFRLADSLPQTVLRELEGLKTQFEARNPLPWSDDTKRLYYRVVTPYENRMLDKGYGSCVLRNENMREILVDEINKLDGDKCDVVAYVIMPNHVHILLLMKDENVLHDVIRRLKAVSGYYINRIMRSAGKVWMKSYFDRIVRNHDALKHAVQYILNNPRYLSSSDYTLYINKSIVDTFGNWLR